MIWKRPTRAITPRSWLDMRSYGIANITASRSARLRRWTFLAAACGKAKYAHSVVLHARPSHRRGPRRSQQGTKHPRDCSRDRTSPQPRLARLPPIMKRTNFDRSLEGQLENPQFAARFHPGGAAWDVALRITALRQKAGITQKELARRLKTSPQQISRLESPEYEGQSVSMLEWQKSHLTIVSARRRSEAGELPAGWGALVETHGTLVLRANRHGTTTPPKIGCVFWSASRGRGRGFLIASSRSSCCARNARVHRAATNKLCPVISWGCGRPRRKSKVGATSARMPSSTRKFLASFAT
ncbi:MAG: helix-turn-helix domain-containing protein [Chthoniobacterales bacterium]